jgi:hypothetical protein
VTTSRMELSLASNSVWRMRSGMFTGASLVRPATGGSGGMAGRVG